MNLKSRITKFIKSIDLAKIKIPSEILALLFVILLMSAAFLPSLEISPSHKLTTAKFERICKQSGFTIEDVSASYHPEFFSEVAAGSGEGYYIGYYTFSHRAYAKAYYTLYLTSLQTGARTEKYTYNSHYNRFYTSTDEGVIFLYRNNDIMIYITGDPSHDAAFDELIEKLKL